jgi:hypothetical protein
LPPLSHCCLCHLSTTRYGCGWTQQHNYVSCLVDESFFGAFVFGWTITNG